MTWSVRITQRDFEQLQAHLHPGDHDEHAAFLYAGQSRTTRGRRLLVKRIVPVPDADFGPSDRGGYRQVSPRAVARAAIDCHDQELCLMWAHSHPGAIQHVGFSEPDRATHRRAHPHLIDATGGRPVTSLVMGTRSVAGEVWTPDGEVIELTHLEVVGARYARLTAAPQEVGPAAMRFARQVMMFGAAGQQALRSMTVGVVGAGGGGSLIIQALAHLGVGRIIVIDDDRVEVTNLSRIVGATIWDARFRRLKVRVARRLVKAIDPSIEFVGIAGDVTCLLDARALVDCDFVFSATDTHHARFAVNALCHQYLIPGAQVGAKVTTTVDGSVDLAYAMYRPIDLAGACLECAHAIDPDALRREQLPAAERRAQNYVDAGEDQPLVDPSVITLNNQAVALAMLDFQFAATSGFPPGTRLGHRIYHAPQRELRERETSPRAGCRWCDPQTHISRFARGDDLDLPLRRARDLRSSPVAHRASLAGWRARRKLGAAVRRR